MTPSLVFVTMKSQKIIKKIKKKQQSVGQVIELTLAHNSPKYLVWNLA